MQRLLLIALACVASLAAELALASTVPLSVYDQFVAALMQQKLDRAAALGDRPKLVVMAGSNGLFSHRCEAMEPVAGLPCVNASVSVEMGLDYLFARWKPLLHPGDVVYLPVEADQLVRSRAQHRLSSESAVMVRQDWGTLFRLAPDRILAAVLNVDVRGRLFQLFRERSPDDDRRVVDHALASMFNAWGDRAGHAAADADGAHGKLDDVHESEPTAAQLRDGYGTALTAAFVRWATAHGVVAVGGLATTFDDIPLPEATLAAERAAYEGNGGRFLLLPNRSRYPRHDFFDTRFHLYEACQVRHSILVAAALARTLGRTPGAPAPWAEAMRCPDPAAEQHEAAVPQHMN